MDFINEEGVSTETITRKSQELHNLEIETSHVNNQIENLKEWIGDIKAKRIAAEIALDNQIRTKRQVLEKRKRRERQLKRELDQLLVRTYMYFSLYLASESVCHIRNCLSSKENYILK